MRTPLKVERNGAVAELTVGLKTEKRSVNQIRLRGVLAVAGGQTVPTVARTLSVSERALRNWIHAYQHHGLAGLQDQRAGRVCRLSAEDLTRLKQRIHGSSMETDGVCSLRGSDIRQILKCEFGVGYAESSVYYLLHHQLGFSYLKPRPIHRKSDPAAQDTFKKNSPKRSMKSAKIIPASGSKSGLKTRVDSGSKGH